MKKRKEKNWTAVGLCLLLSFLLLAGCQPAEPEQPTTEPEPPAVEGTAYDVTLYFSNDAYAETGDESLAHVVAVESSILVPEGEEALDCLLAALGEAPEEPAGLSTVTTGIVFTDTYVAYPEDITYEEGSDEGTIFVDVSSEGLSGGSLTEMFFVEQVVETLLANEAFSTIEAFSCNKVQFLVDGEPTETLMGHYDATEPFVSQL